MKSQTEDIMKQFNLEEYLANPKKKVVTRDGRDVRIICTDFNNPIYPVIGEIKGAEWPTSFTASGRQDAVCESPIDLFFASKRHEGWVNIYPGPFTGVVVYKSEEDAKHCANANAKVIATVKIEWEE